jgi:hypothetical protein
MCFKAGLGYDPARNTCVKPTKATKAFKETGMIGDLRGLTPNRLSPMLSGPGSFGGSEPATGDQQVPGILDTDIFGTGISVGDVIDFGKFAFGGNGNGNGGGKSFKGNGKSLVADEPCPGVFSVPGPGGTCIDLTALPPGGDPALTGRMNGANGANGFGAAVKGRFGVGIMPRVDVQTVKRCPRGMALGLDGVCYDGLGRNSPKRAWPMGVKPLLTGGDRNAIRKAASAGRKLMRSKKQLKLAAKALEKAC